MGLLTGELAVILWPIADYSSKKGIEYLQKGYMKDLERF